MINYWLLSFFSEYSQISQGMVFFFIIWDFFSWNYCFNVDKSSWGCLFTTFLWLWDVFDDILWHFVRSWNTFLSFFIEWVVVWWVFNENILQAYILVTLTINELLIFIIELISLIILGYLWQFYLMFTIMLWVILFLSS